MQGSCNLFDFAVDIDGSSVVVSAGGNLVQHLTLTNVSNFPIRVRLASRIGQDDRGFGPYIRVDASCGCASGPMLNAMLDAPEPTSSDGLIPAGQSVVVDIQMRTIPEITNDLQGASLTYFLLVYAEQAS